jgi:hypothetical protein
MQLLRGGGWCAAASIPACIRFVKHDEANFLFFISHLALIDAILLTGIAFRQIR